MIIPTCVNTYVFIWTQVLSKAVRIYVSYGLGDVVKNDASRKLKIVPRNKWSNFHKDDYIPIYEWSELNHYLKLENVYRVGYMDKTILYLSI